MNKRKLAVITLGCNKNQVDSEFLITGLADNFLITTNLYEAEIIVLNTCAFLKSARLEVKNYVKKFIKFKNKNCKCLVLTGCYVELEKENIFNLAIGVDLAIGLSDIDSFDRIIKDFFDNKNESKFYPGNGNIFGLFSENNISRVLSNPNFAYLKISEGCNNNCAYCLIPKIRGDFRSRKKEVVLNEAKFLLENGIREINIVSQDIGQYGKDISNQYNFVSLIRDINDLYNQDFWIRLLYLHPKHITKELVKIIKNSKNICKYIDIPIQHINDKILKSMGRNIKKSEIIEKLDLLKLEIPNIILRTTFIIGFPDETEDDFNELLDFLDKKYFFNIGVFIYSDEKETKSFNFKNKILKKEKNLRYNIIMQKIQKILFSENKKFLLDNKEKIFKFLPEYIIDKNLLKGRIYSMAPEVDGNVYIKNVNKNILDTFFYRKDKFLDIKLIFNKGYDFFGKILK